MEPVSFVTGTITATAVFTGVAVALLLHLVNQETPPATLRTFRVGFLALAIFTGLITVSVGLRQPNFIAVQVIDWGYLFLLIAVIFNLLEVLIDWHRHLNPVPPVGNARSNQPTTEQTLEQVSDPLRK